MRLFSAMIDRNDRNEAIDLLRGIAVLLVMCRHWYISDFLWHAGWMGVDLFFVLSGFLIAGLLFSEYERYSKVNLLQFFIRRVFKIVPLLYVLLILTIGVYLIIGQSFSSASLFRDMFFIQNYGGGVYGHTWSLGVELHFYLIIMLCFVLLQKWRIVLSQRSTIIIFMVFLVVPFVLRTWNYYTIRDNTHYATHMRVDSLFAGVLVCYMYRYKGLYLKFLHAKARQVLLLMALVCLSVFGFIEPDNFFTQSIGLVLIYLSFSCILLYTITLPEKNRPFIKLPALIGFYSYAIYLVHVPVMKIFGWAGIGVEEGPLNIVYFVFYVLVCLVTGIFFSELVEQPMLRFRNKLIPSNSIKTYMPKS